MPSLDTCRTVLLYGSIAVVALVGMGISYLIAGSGRRE